jgi:hypothetical protein
MLSGIPRQCTGTLAEKLVVPLIHFVLFGYLPVAAMRRSQRAAFGVACGQLLICRRNAYFAAGGHRRIAHRIHDGMALARCVREAGFMTDLADFTDLAHCRMYPQAGTVTAGFAKNAHEGLGSPRGILPWTVLLVAGQCLSILAVPAALAGMLPLVPALTAAVSAYAARALLDRRVRNPVTGTLLHPLGIAILIAIQWYALCRRLAGAPVAWKTRVPVESSAGLPVATPSSPETTCTYATGPDRTESNRRSA